MSIPSNEQLDAAAKLGRASPPHPGLKEEIERNKERQRLEQRLLAAKVQFWESLAKHVDVIGELISESIRERRP